MTEVLKMVKKCKIYQNEGFQGGPVNWDLTKKFAQGPGFDSQLKICPGDGNAWK